MAGQRWAYADNTMVLWALIGITVVFIGRVEIRSQALDGTGIHLETAHPTLLKKFEQDHCIEGQGVSI